MEIGMLLYKRDLKAAIPPALTSWDSYAAGSSSSNAGGGVVTSRRRKASVPQRSCLMSVVQCL
jgi:hypothetical protein